MVLFAAAAQYFFGITLFLTSVLLILTILIQRGRGGGLAGALGGAGGQSAFGTKAGDTFTRITLVMAAFWILLSAAAIAVLNDSGQKLPDGPLSVTPAKPGTPDDKKDAETPSGDGKSSDTTSPPAEPATESSSAPAQPAETKPADVKPADAKPTDSKPADESK